MTAREPACPHLRRLVSPYDHGLKHQGRVVHANTNESVVRDLDSRGWVRGLTNGAMVRHFAGEATVYFTADGRVRTPEVLLMLDVDCHRVGTYASAVAFTEHLRDHHFPGLYFEPSTNGNGVHAYLLLDTRGFGDERTHSLFEMMDRALKGIHADWQAENPHLEVELVEAKGHPPRIDWGRDGKVARYTSGQLAKLPREVDRRLDEFRRTTKVDDRRVSDLYRRWKDEVVRRKEVKPERAAGEESRVEVAPTKGAAKPKSGSISGHVVGREALDRFDAYRDLARRYLPGPLRTSGREAATSEDLAILLLVLEACTERMNADGSMPTARIMTNWATLHEEGEVERPFNPKRYAALRDFLSREGLLDWEDESYLPHQMSDEGKGRAARWRASEGLMARIREARDGVNPEGEVRVVQFECEVLERVGGEKREHLYGDYHDINLIGNPGIRPIQGSHPSRPQESDPAVEGEDRSEGNRPSRPQDFVFALEVDDPTGGEDPRWLRELTFEHYPRPVLRASSGWRMAA